MDKRLELETEGLIKSWMHHDEGMLRDYLVADVEDPRINIQSILTRHFLIEALIGERFTALMDHELRFGAVMNWALKLVKQPGGADDFPAILHALESGADNAEGVPIPHFVSRTFAALPAQVNEMVIPSYLRELLIEAPRRSSRSMIDGEWITSFERIWRAVLANQPAQGVTVLEPACGSANDYRFLDAFGIARLVEYTGFDLCEKNIANARALFPAARFETGNAFEIRGADKSFDVCFVHDLFEHLSLEAMDVAVAEICRVTREGICAGFFSMHEEEDPIVRPVDDYHWNTLSLVKASALFERHGFAVHPIHVGTFLKWKFGCEETHNDNAYTFFATADESQNTDDVPA